jgi:hypothetical protein
MTDKITMQSPGGLEAVQRKAGGKWSVGDRIMSDRNGNCTDRSVDNWGIATIKRLYLVDRGGSTEFADILFDGDNTISTRHFSMFFNEILEIVHG